MILQAAIVACIAVMAAVCDPSTSRGHVLGKAPSAPAANHHAPSAWLRTSVSHYGTCRHVDHAHGCDGYLGGTTRCGRTVRSTSMFVAALKPSLAHCGTRITLRYHGRRFQVTVQDTGATRRDDRAFDAAPGLYRAMGSHDLARATYQRGWH